MQRQNTTLDDVCAVIGLTATVRLVSWFGGSNVYIPDVPAPGHKLRGLIGDSALKLLCTEFGDSFIWIPVDLGSRGKLADAVKKRVAELVLAGGGSREMSETLSISQRQIQRIRRELAGAGLIPSNAPGESKIGQERI